MKYISLACVSLGFCTLLSHPANAQMQQGYAGDDRPQVQVDRSVLEDLKGYEPPPMFANPPSESLAEPIVETPPKIAPPAAPTLTTPRAEDILNHPVENTQVITEQRQRLTVPADDSKVNNPLLPMPSADADDDTPHVLPRHKPKSFAKKEAPKNSPADRLTIIDPATPPAVTPAVTPKNKPATVTSATAGNYRPKAPKTMPAVPSVAVEKAALPELPPTKDSKTTVSQPTIGERMMDAALEKRIESDTDKIKETLNKTPVKKMTEAQPKTKPQGQNGSLVFSAGADTLSNDLKAQIRKSTLPQITKEKTSRIQVLSFAASPDGSEGSARRVALARALAVRDYLLEQGIAPSRIDVRALASQKGEPAPDRVDIVLLKP